MFVRGITVFRAQGTLARGDTHFPRSSAHLKSRPGKAPIFRALPSRPKSTPRLSQGFGNLPESRPGFREIPYTTTISSLWSYGVFVPKYPARAVVPLNIWGFASTIRTLPNMVYGLPKQAHESLNLQPRSLARFPVLWINLRTYRTTLLSYPDNYHRLISEFQVFAGRITQYYFTTIHTYVCSIQEHKTNWIPFHITKGFATSIGANTHNDTRLLGNPNPPTVDNRHKTPIPTTVGHKYIIYLSDRYIRTTEFVTTVAVSPNLVNAISP